MGREELTTYNMGSNTGILDKGKSQLTGTAISRESNTELIIAAHSG
jgi:hypothetical protein